MPRRSALLASVAVLAAACQSPPPWEGTFDIPGAAAVLPVEAGGPFNKPIAYASSLHGGQIAILDLKRGVYLADQPTAPFVRAAPLATGEDRQIVGLAAYAPDPDTAWVYAADLAFGKLLRIPHITGRDDRGFPARFHPTASKPRFIDADNSGDSATLTNLEVRSGYTSTEDWTVTYDGTRWWVEGSRSGRQQATVPFGQSFVGDKRDVQFTVEGTATKGDQITFSTDNGIDEIDLGMIPTNLSIQPDQDWLAVSLEDSAGQTGGLDLVDPATATVGEEVPLPEGAIPGRMAWSEDGTTLYVSDGALPQVYAIPVDSSGAGDIVTYPLPWPVMDVAPMRSTDHNLLYVAPVTGRSVWILDLDSGRLVDFNPIEPGVNGLEFDTMVRGIEAMPMPYQWQQTDDDHVRIWGRSVAVSLYTGRVDFMAEGTGCLVQDPLGPRTNANQGITGTLDYTTNYSNVTTGAFLERNSSNDRHVIVNRCGGVAKAEQWSLTYSRDLQAWQVRGTLSGVQQHLAYEDERYVSDDGAVSFVIRGGTTPSQDGWKITFSVLPGLVEANGDNNGNGQRDVQFDLPGDPVFFHHDRIGTRGNGWLTVRDSPFVLVPAQAADLVGRVDPVTGHVEVVWW